MPLLVQDGKILFPAPLVEATVVRRPNRFIVEVEVAGDVVACHCPTTGRIGNLVLDGLPCLLSRADNPARKTPYTVEAVSVTVPGAGEMAWIGINQNAVNRYVEQALAHHLLPDIATPAEVSREQTLGASRLDFLLDDATYVEVKTPLENLQVPLGDHVKTRPVKPMASTDRFVKHIGELGASLAAHQRAVLLVCFQYDNPGFEVLKSTRHETVKAEVAKAVESGVEIWQINFHLDQTGVRVQRHFELTDRFLGC
ncbi:DNA/RNA nuclease SfsA [Streptomyces sp. GTA36]|uniref:DNA/RNA nuclease SfsA n=1 Tax=Streptomyces sp. 2-1 TaxID=412710 RepID=UPI003AFB61ED